MPAFDIQQIWAELHRLEKEKANVCPVRDMSTRIDILETAVNLLRSLVVRLETNIEELEENARDKS